MHACLNLFWRSSVFVSAFSQFVAQHSIVRFSAQCETLISRVRFYFLCQYSESASKTSLQTKLGTGFLNREISQELCF